MRVLVLEGRALHLGFLGCYGCDWVETPALDRLAAAGVVFDRHYADTLGEARSPFTGRCPLPVPGPAVDLGPGLAGLLDAAAAGFTYLDARNGPLRPGGVADALKALREGRGLVWVDLPSLGPPWHVAAEDLLRYFDDQDAEDAGPLLAPVAEPPVGVIDRSDFETWESVRRTYAGVVSHFDRSIGALLESLEPGGLLDEVLFVLTADLGLPLGEHGAVGLYRPWLHEELVHLPLVIRLPGGEHGGARVAALTQPVDLFPTLLEVLGAAVPPCHGHSLWPLLRGKAEAVRPYACGGMRLGGSAEAALWSLGWGFLLPTAVPDGDPPRSPRLYVKPDDRWEVNDVRQHHLDLAEHMEQVLLGYAAATHGPGPIVAPALRDVEAELAAATGHQEGPRQEG